MSLPELTWQQASNLQTALNREIQSGWSLSIRRYQRLTAWLGGESLSQIGRREGTSRQAIFQSVNRDLQVLLQRANVEGKDKQDEHQS